MLEIHVRSVDRGADIGAFSQYPHEGEFHWAPGCFLEPTGMREEVIGAARLKVIQVRVNCNLKTFTIDELLAMRKSLHLQAFDLLINDVHHSLSKYEGKVRERLASDKTQEGYDEDGSWVGVDERPEYTAESLIDQVINQCKEVRTRHEKFPADVYAEAGRYRELVTRMLETSAMAPSKLLGWIEDRRRMICLDFASSLRTCHRERISFLQRNLPADPGRRRERAQALCVAMGLLVADARERNELGEPRLFEAAAAGRPGRDLLLLLDAGAGVDEPDAEGSTPLFVAARNGHADLVETLFKAWADIDLANRSGETPVWIAARNGQRACVEVAIQLHADVHVADKGGTTPAMVAAQRGHHAVLGLLLRAGAAADAREEMGCTAAFLAAHNGHARCIGVLGRAGADLALANTSGHTPLMMAAQEGEDQCVEALLAAAGDASDGAGDAGPRAGAGLDAVNDEGRTAVFAAAEGGHARCVELLLAARADAAVRDTAGETAAAVAEREGRAPGGASEGRARCLALLRRFEAERAAAAGEEGAARLPGEEEP